MTSELLAIAPTGATLYAVLLDEAGQAYRAGQASQAPAWPAILGTSADKLVAGLESW